MTPQPSINFTIRHDDLTSPEVAALLRAHHENAAQHSPPEDVHVLDLARLREPDITFWTVWSEGELLGCGALKELSPDHGEIKSMHTAEAHRGKGVASKLVEHILAEARSRGYRRVSLETGTMEAFAPARLLYARYGFQVCPPFGPYWESPNSVCMTLELRAAQEGGLQGGADR